MTETERCAKLGLTYRGDFLNSLSKEEFDAGLIRIRVPSQEDIAWSDESGWAWVTPEVKAKINDGYCNEKFTAILCNQMLNFYSKLCWGVEVGAEISDHDNICHVADDWARENLVRKDGETEWEEHF